VDVGTLTVDDVGEELGVTVAVGAGVVGSPAVGVGVGPTVDEGLGDELDGGVWELVGTTTGPMVGCTWSPVVIKGTPERGGATKAPAATHAAAASQIPAFAIAYPPQAVASAR
jgi:hypothetical protein